MPRAQRIPLFTFDPGWLFVITGVVVIAATVLIPAADDLAEARWTRDRALAIERHRLERLENYSRFLQAMNNAEESVVLAMAAKQLNLVPEGWTVLEHIDDPGRANASVFGALEPGELRIYPREKRETTLSRLCTGKQTRLWMLLGGAACLLIGVLPPSTPARSARADLA